MNIDTDDSFGNIFYRAEAVFSALQDLQTTWTAVRCLFAEAKDALTDEEFCEFLKMNNFDEVDAENILNKGHVCGKCIFLRSIQ